MRRAGGAGARRSGGERAQVLRDRLAADRAIWERLRARFGTRMREFGSRTHAHAPGESSVERERVDFNDAWPK